MIHGKNHYIVLVAEKEQKIVFVADKNMETKETKWMHITCVKDTGKTKVFELHSKDGNFLLGEIRWYGNWRQYAFIPRENTVFEKQCLKDIADLLIELMNERKANN